MTDCYAPEECEAVASTPRLLDSVSTIVVRAIRSALARDPNGVVARRT